MKKFEDSESIGYSLSNLNLSGHDMLTAKKLVAEGTNRWAWCHGGTLTLVPSDYILKSSERFLKETPSGFEIQT